MIIRLPCFHLAAYINQVHLSLETQIDYQGFDYECNHR